jgi:VIT1/CCC1 family predicted Fe2+/Mn2+ transporter
MNIEELVVFGVPAVGVIIALVALAKFYGMDAKWAPLLAIGVGSVLSVCNALVALIPGFEVWYQVLVAGLLAGLLACGIYSGQKALRGQ